MKQLRAAALVFLAVAMPACDGDGVTDPGIADLVGTWSGSSFTFTRVANPAHQVDLINHLGGTLSLTIHSNQTFTGSINLPDQTPGPLPIGGSLEVDAEAGTLDVRFNQLTLSYGLFTDFTADYTLTANGQVLTWSFGPVPFDFPQNPEEGEEPAVAVAVLTRV
jgi:hypothetical protein